MLGAASRIKCDDAAIARVEETAAGVWHYGANAFADVPYLLFACCGVEADELVPFDIDVDEFIIPPDWAFAPFGNACADGLECKC